MRPTWARWSTTRTARALIRVRKSNTGMFTQLISDARAAEWEHVKPGDEDRLFYRMAWWKKVIVMAGGPTVNILIAFFLFWGVYATFGNPAEPDVKPVVSDVLDCVVPYAEDGRACEADDPVTPAKQAGLQNGDEFLAVNGTPVTSWEGLPRQIRDNADGEVTLLVDRDGEQLEVTTNTIVTARPISDDPTDETLDGTLGLGESLGQDVPPVLEPDPAVVVGGVIDGELAAGGLAQREPVGTEPVAQDVGGGETGAVGREGLDALLARAPQLVVRPGQGRHDRAAAEVGVLGQPGQPVGGQVGLGARLLRDLRDLVGADVPQRRAEPAEPAHDGDGPVVVEHRGVVVELALERDLAGGGVVAPEGGAKRVAGVGGDERRAVGQRVASLSDCPSTRTVRAPAGVIRTTFSACVFWS